MSIKDRKCIQKSWNYFKNQLNSALFLHYPAITLMTYQGDQIGNYAITNFKLTFVYNIYGYVLFSLQQPPKKGEMRNRKHQKSFE